MNSPSLAGITGWLNKHLDVKENLKGTALAVGLTLLISSLLLVLGLLLSNRAGILPTTGRWIQHQWQILSQGFQQFIDKHSSLISSGIIIAGLSTVIIFALLIYQSSNVR